MLQPKRPKIAVVGSGLAGLSAAWALHQTKRFEVHIYEASDRLGGHGHTVPLSHSEATAMVDTGFMVLNSSTYPTLLGLLDHLGVKTEPTETSFSVSPLGWSSSSPFSSFSLGSWRLLLEILRFSVFAPDLLEGKDGDEVTVDEYLSREHYSTAFQDSYIRPLTAGLSFPGTNPFELPAAALVRYLHRHRLLLPDPSSQWLTINGGAQSYIMALTSSFPKWQVHVSTPITHVGTRESDGKPQLCILGEGEEWAYMYDHIVIATDGERALQLLGDGATEIEKEVLGSFHTAAATVVLHTTPSPTGNKDAWNYYAAPGGVPELTFNLNILQRIPTVPFGSVFATLNPLSPPQGRKEGEWTFRRVVASRDAARALRRMEEVQGRRGITFVGANGGDAEDACVSGILAARRLGARVPVRMVRRRWRVRRGVEVVGVWVLRLLVWVLWEAFVWAFGDGDGRKGWGKGKVG